MPVLKQFLKLYTTISLPKLAALMDTDEAAVKDQLKILEVTASSSLIALSNTLISLSKGYGCHARNFAVSAGMAMMFDLLILQSQILLSRAPSPRRLCVGCAH